jgi:hypothetical protein
MNSNWVISLNWVGEGQGSERHKESLHLQDHDTQQINWRKFPVSK